MAAKKSIVMEKGNGWAIILTPDGEYKKIKTHDYLEVGQLYQAKAPIPQYAAAAVLLLALILAGIDYFSVQAYAQVSNLAELGVNRWGRVVAVQPKNSGGQHVLEAVNVKHDKLEKAVEKICRQTLRESKAANRVKKIEFSVNTAGKVNPKARDKILDKMNQGYKKAVHQQIKVKKTHIIPQNKVKPDREDPQKNINPDVERENQEIVKSKEVTDSNQLTNQNKAHGNRNPENSKEKGNAVSKGKK